MMDAARDGDVPAYLASYTGPMENSLRQIVKEKGESSLAEYIRAFNASVKGVALQAPQSVSDNEVRVRVEFVYKDRNETQIYYLQQSPDGKLHGRRMPRESRLCFRMAHQWSE